MATLLTTSKMDPALAARIDASVRGRRKKQGASKLGPRVVAVLRIGGLAIVLALVSWFTVSKSRNRRDVEQAKKTLLDDVHAKSASLTAYDVECVPRAATWLVRSAGAYEGDVIADELRGPGAFAAALARPIVYVRGPIGSFTSTASVVDVASSSAKDPFLLCIVQPPSTRAEKVLVGKVRAAYLGGPILEIATDNVRRLGDATAGLPFLQPSWAARVEGADDLGDLAKLRRDLDRAPVDRAKHAARAELLLFAMDEPGEGTTELDGERAHAVRVGLVNVASGTVLLRMRKPVDPKWISVAMRAEFASGLDACALAMDVHEAVRAAR